MPQAYLSDHAVLVLSIEGWARYERVAASPALVAAYQEIMECSDLLYPPQMVIVKSAGGAGGIYLHDAGLILLGLEDVRDLASALVTLHYGHLPIARRRRVFPAIFQLVAGRILSHEIGHAMHFAGLPTPYEDAESAADFFAGGIDARRGKARELGAMVFWQIGCNRPLCSHPPSAVRADAYCFGYDLEVATTLAWSA